MLLTATAPLSTPATPHIRQYNGPKIIYNDTNTTTPNLAIHDDQQPTLIDKWAVVIGISDYQGTGNDLLYPDNDANDMYNYLVSVGYPTSHIVRLLNSQATASTIIAAINWMNSHETHTTSECVFFYSGHGTTYTNDPDGDGEYTDEAIVGYNLVSILDGQLKQRFQTFNSHKILLIFDSCYCGGMNDIETSGRLLDMACQETQLSWDGTPSMNNGVFTYYYMQGLYNYDSGEGAQSYASPRAHNAVLQLYGATMTTRQCDYYTGTWHF
jgi:metacaspase-1